MGFFRKQKIKRDTKRVFFKKGTCSRAFFYLLNREFGHPMDQEEQAADPLAGGIIQQGYQCGMLWGASLAMGAESWRRTEKVDDAVNLAVTASIHIYDSFVNRTGTPDCEEITGVDWTKKLSILKYFIKGKMFNCYFLADKWAPEAFEAAKEGLDKDLSGLPKKPVSCASEVVKKMGGSEEEQSIVAGLAGGIALSGNGCGALGAAVWKHTLERIKKGEYKYILGDAELEKILKDFYEASDYKMECREICGKMFKDIKDHTDFLKKGGCKEIINTCAKSAAGET